MEIIKQFFNRLSVNCVDISNNVWEKTQLFLDKMSAFYSIEKKVILEVREEENNTSKKQIEQGLKFDSMNSFVKYLGDRCSDIDVLSNFVNTNNNFFGSIYEKNLKNLKKEIGDLNKDYKKDAEKKAWDELDDLNDKFFNKFFDEIKTNLFETVYDNIHRLSLTNGNDSLISNFKKLIDNYMKEAGFRKENIARGECLNSQICSSENPEYTDKHELHKTIKNIVWPPYSLTYFSCFEGKQVKKIIKGKVICYSTKILGEK